VSLLVTTPLRESLGPPLSKISYDFYVSPTGGTGAGTFADPWSWAYAIGSGAGSAQGDGKLSSLGAKVAVRGGSYALTDASYTVAAHGSLGSGIDAPDGKLIFRAYQPYDFVLPEIPDFNRTSTGNPPSSGDLIVVSSSATYVWFWGFKTRFIVSTRVPASEPSGFCFSAYQSAPTGMKVLYSQVHEGPGGIFLDSRDAGGTVFDGGEVYGSIFWNVGWAMGDGGGHHIYSHHKGSSYRRNIQANIFGPDEANGVQHYSVAGIYGWEQSFDHQDNVHFNSGTLNKVAGLGAETGSGSHVVLGGNTSGNAHMNAINCKRNYFWWKDGHGDNHIMVGQGGADQIGAGVVVDGNYGRGGGKGYGTIRILSILASGGTLSFQSNKFRVEPSSATTNGRLIRMTENGGAGYTVTLNDFYRALGNGGLDCGPDSGSPSAFADATGLCRTLAQWHTDCGFSGNTLTQTDPATTVAFNIRADKYEPNRSHVVYYNWASLARIPVDLSATLSSGMKFRVDDWRDISGAQPITVYDAATGGSPVTVFTGALVYFPTTQLADPAMSGANWGVGNETAPPATAPDFNVFLVRRTT